MTDHIFYSQLQKALIIMKYLNNIIIIQTVKLILWITLKLKDCKKKL
jgi:hypothetical protein